MGIEGEGRWGGYPEMPQRRFNEGILISGIDLLSPI